jgi:hypothetical protein
MIWKTIWGRAIAGVAAHPAARSLALTGRGRSAPRSECAGH